ncbi:HD domain-containing protein [Acidaminobacter sp. JC074]|uniref:HD domain-containing protein n=1 Tax=Acidaminobacter sp. JC074 TaxID=2530199 RepID=UPI001F10304F|nr:HD domain-containing protein [Acidaminobacter sp. JC074]MCH4888074.1 HD domain-containing protein [Acidaminobacter sp. JC074]
MDKLIRCLQELEQLKLVDRGLNVGSRKESTAEHSWSCMLIADILIDYIDEPLDRLKVLEYLLYHDLVEVFAGDAKFNNPEELKGKDEKEALALDKIKSLIPKSERFSRIIHEYESKESREAKFAKAVDCLDTCVRNLNDDNKDKSDGFDEALIRAKYAPHVKEFSFINDLYEMMMHKLVEQNKI